MKTQGVFHLESFLVVLIVISAILYHLFAIYFKNRVVKYVLKPGTMALIIILAAYNSALDSTFGTWVVVALIFSVIGDVFLMLEDKWFVHGLFSFLVAHLVYIAAFWVNFSFDFASTTSIVTALILLLVAIGFFLLLYSSVQKEGGAKLSFAVALYITIISVMVWSAVLVGSSILIVASILFLVSDAVLAFDKFKQRFTSAEYMVMATYFSAQLLFALSIV